MGPFGPHNVFASDIRGSAVDAHGVFQERGGYTARRTLDTQFDTQKSTGVGDILAVRHLALSARFNSPCPYYRLAFQVHYVSEDGYDFPQSFFYHLLPGDILNHTWGTAVNTRGFPCQNFFTLR